ncbi:hypothetical protein T190611E02C_10851 [Tenacibaculum sp. 190524A05c]
MKKEAKKSSLHSFSLKKSHPQNGMKRTHPPYVGFEQLFILIVSCGGFYGSIYR